MANMDRLSKCSSCHITILILDVHTAKSVVLRSQFVGVQLVSISPALEALNVLFPTSPLVFFLSNLPKLHHEFSSCLHKERERERERETETETERQRQRQRQRELELELELFIVSNTWDVCTRGEQ